MFNVDAGDSDDVSGLRQKPALRSSAPIKLAALDLGSNSFHLVVAILTDDGHFTVIARSKEKVQLGESAFQTGRISAQGFERGLQAVRKLADIARQHGSDAVVSVATSAFREASNGGDFVRCASRASGFPIHVIDGLEEARLVCLGTRQGLTLSGRRVAMIDFGGGSTEVVLADDDGYLLTASLNLGALRLRSSWTCQDPPSALELAVLAERVTEALEDTIARVRRLGFDLAVFSCGAARKLLKLAASEFTVTTGEPPSPSKPRLTLEMLQHLERRLSLLDAAGRTALPDFSPGTVDTLLPGAIALRVILDRLGVDAALVSSTGLREGMIADYIKQSRAASAVRIAAM
jgi:exopolyphosphatase/guanosine-5'-triphosphate,3'-diphosphate pyrophosphatase